MDPIITVALIALLGAIINAPITAEIYKGWKLTRQKPCQDQAKTDNDSVVNDY